jgi:hypothetical protein
MRKVDLCHLCLEHVWSSLHAGAGLVGSGRFPTSTNQRAISCGRFVAVNHHYAAHFLHLPSFRLSHTTDWPCQDAALLPRCRNHHCSILSSILPVRAAPQEREAHLNCLQIHFLLRRKSSSSPSQRSVDSRFVSERWVFILESYDALRYTIFRKSWGVTSHPEDRKWSVRNDRVLRNLTRTVDVSVQGDVLTFTSKQCNSVEIPRHEHHEIPRDEQIHFLSSSLLTLKGSSRTCCILVWIVTTTLMNDLL